MQILVLFFLKPNLLDFNFAFANPLKLAGLNGTLLMFFSKSLIFKSWLIELLLFYVTFLREELLVNYSKTGYHHSMTITSYLEISLFGIFSTLISKYDIFKPNLLQNTHCYVTFKIYFNWSWPFKIFIKLSLGALIWDLRAAAKVRRSGLGKKI